MTPSVHGALIPTGDARGTGRTGTIGAMAAIGAAARSPRALHEQGSPGLLETARCSGSREAYGLRRP